MTTDDLAATARTMVVQGTGILAADESAGTIEEWFGSIAVEWNGGTTNGGTTNGDATNGDATRAALLDRAEVNGAVRYGRSGAETEHGASVGGRPA